VNLLELETPQGRTGKLAEHLSRLDLLTLDELGYLPFARTGGQLPFHLVSRLVSPRKRQDIDDMGGCVLPLCQALDIANSSLFWTCTRQKSYKVELRLLRGQRHFLASLREHT
jgi:hypothetical protein